MHVKFQECPMCEQKSFERLKTFSHCVNCLFVDDPTLKKRFPVEQVLKNYKQER